MNHPSTTVSSLALVALSLLLLLPSSAQAGHPFATDDAGTVGRATLEVELSAATLRWLEGGPSSEVGFGMAVHAGLAETLDLGVGFGYVLAEENDQWTAAMDDPAFDLKWRFLEPDAAVPGLAVRLDYKAPQRLAAGSTGHDVGGLLIASWELEKIAVHVDVGAYAHELTGSNHVSAYAAAAFVAEIASGVFAGVEGTADGVPHDVHGASGLAALVVEPLPGYAVSLGTGAVWEEPNTVGWMATIGLTVGIGGEQ